MEFVPTPIIGAFAIRHEVRSDVRGRFKRQYCEQEFANAGLNTRWVQVNHSVTLGTGSIRGLHFQRPPAAEAKLVSCPVGSAFDVAIDLRAGSPTFLKWAAVEIDETSSFYIPEGCAHGFQALADEVHLIYLHSDFYDPSTEDGIRFDDPAIAVQWPLPAATVSDRDHSFALIDDNFRGIAL
jgi:dTDP-4-dehydrorhamnose 3,5-epimerase